MRYLFLAVLSVFIAIHCPVMAGSEPANPSSAASGTTHKDETNKCPPPAEDEKKLDEKFDLTVVGDCEKTKTERFTYKMGDTFTVRASGDWPKNLKDPKTTHKIWLYFGGERLTHLSAIPLQDPKEKGTLLLNFRLVRDSADDNERKEWDTFFKSQDGYEMTVQPAIGVDNDLPAVVSPGLEVKFSVAKSYKILLVLVVCVTVFLVSYWLIVTRTKMLRDADTNYYSLGKSQMAFWGLLVVLTFLGVWALTGTMERIPPQALVLLGISASTGLGAVVIGSSKRSEIQIKTDDIKKNEKRPLEIAKAANPATFPSTDQTRLNELDAKINELNAQLNPGVSKGFLSDICDDGNGISFHRLQVVGWTLVLGVVFVRAVSEVMSMPEFSQTLLTLMGVSNATYLGFKIPEK